MKKKRMYESPHTQVNTVVTESGFCAASVIDQEDKDGIKTEGHEVGQTIDGSVWKDNEWE